MTRGSSGNGINMLRWFKDRSKTKQDKKGKVEDDYGFQQKKKKQLIVEETENGHSVIIKDNDMTLVYPQSFCKFHYRARMPTPVQNFRETSSHIYDEIPEHSVRARLESVQQRAHEADLIKDTHNANTHVDLTNAIEVGPYLIVPLVNSQTGDVEIVKRSIDSFTERPTNGVDSETILPDLDCRQCVPDEDTSLWPQVSNDDQNDTKVVLTRCVKSKSGTRDSDNTGDEFPESVLNSAFDLCSFIKGAPNTGCDFRICTNSSPSADSNSRTLTGTPDSTTQTPDTLSERSLSCAISNEICEDVECANDIASDNRKSGSPAASKTKEIGDGNETGYEYDLSTSGESEKSKTSEQEDYEVYLSKIESNLELKHNVRKLVQHEDGDSEVGEVECAGDDNGNLESMTYVSSLSEYSSAASHISDVSADRSESDDSSGYYECAQESGKTRHTKSSKGKDAGVHLARSVSAPEGASLALKNKLSVSVKTHVKPHTGATRSKRSHTHRSKLLDHDTADIYKALSDEDKELYKFPSSSNSSSCSISSRHGRGKTVLAPQPTPVYMDPYRRKSERHNRLLGDLIRMNYDKQLFFH